MEEYISKADAVDAVEYANGNMTWAERDDCKKRIEELSPADVVRVVRCKDCGYFYGNGAWCSHQDAIVHPTPDSFCSYGERREE